MGRQTLGELKLKGTGYSTRAANNFGVRRHPELENINAMYTKVARAMGGTYLIVKNLF